MFEIDNDLLRVVQSRTERHWRDEELVRTDTQLMKVQDGVTGIGTQKAWRTYRNDLRDWPSNSNFPDKNLRPVAPDA